MEVDKKLVQSLADMLMIGISDDELEAIVEDQSFYDLLIFMQNIDTENVPMMHLPFEEETSYLRNDDEEYVLERDLIMKNAPKHNDAFIEVVQVIDK